MSVKKQNRKYLSNNQAGFTLVELMVSLVVSSFVMAAIYSAYQVQQRQYSSQAQVVEMQQNLRAAMLFITSELRMAGYDPQGTAGSGFIEAIQRRVQFTKDIVNSSGTPDRGDGVLTGAMENVYFGFDPNDDVNNTGIIAGSGAASLMLSQDNKTSYQSIADDISAIEFSYNMADGTTTAIPGDLAAITSVTVSILARARLADRNFTNTTTYTTGSGASWGPYNDNFRRRLLIANIKCRNMGL